MRATLLVLVGLIIASGCTSNSAAQVHPTPSIAVHTFAGGCAGTTLTDALPPLWAQGGWSQPRVFPGLWHVFHSRPSIREAREAVKEIGSFARERLEARATPSYD